MSEEKPVPTAVARRATKDTVSKWLNSDKMLEFLKRALPSSIDPARLLQVYYNVVSAKPELQDCTAESLLKVLVFGSQLGLSFDPALKQAWIVPFRDKAAGVTNATLIVGYKGLEGLAIESGYLDAIDTRPVFSGDMFDYEEGAEPKMIHKPNFSTERTTETFMGVYARGWKGGKVTRFEFIPKEDIERHRQSSAAVKSGMSTPWDGWYFEMAGKTAIRILAGHMPQSRESMKMHRAIAADVHADVLGAGQAQQLLVEGFDDVIDVIPVDPKAPPPPASKTDALADKVAAKRSRKTEEKPSPQPAEMTSEPDATETPVEPSDERTALVLWLQDGGKNLFANKAAADIEVSAATGGKFQTLEALATADVVVLAQVKRHYEAVTA